MKNNNLNFKKGDYVIQTINNYDILLFNSGLLWESSCVYNGEIGVIENITSRGTYVIVNFGSKKLVYSKNHNLNQLCKFENTINRLKNSFIKTKNNFYKQKISYMMIDFEKFLYNTGRPNYNTLHTFTNYNPCMNCNDSQKCPYTKFVKQDSSNNKQKIRIIMSGCKQRQDYEMVLKIIYNKNTKRSVK